MSDITEEEIARAVALELAAFRKRMFPDSKVDLLPSEMAQATGIVAGIVGPALRRTRRDERERAAQLVEDQMPATQDMESTLICEALERAAAAIRKG